MEQYDLDYDIDLYFKNIVSQPFIEHIKNGKISPAGRQEINGKKALVANITGAINETEVFYKLVVIETPFTFYQILIWTRADNKEKLEPDMIKMYESFKELPLPKEELPQRRINPDSVTIKLAY